MSSLIKNFNSKEVINVNRNQTFEEQNNDLTNNSNYNQKPNLSYREEIEDKNISSSFVELNVTTYPLKLTLIGNSNVGKTSIIKRFTTNKYDGDKTMSTISVNCQDKKLKIDPFTELCMQIWDTAGQERFRAIARGYLRESNGIFVVFDLSDESSFDDLNLWMKEIDNSDIDKKICVKMLIGNKLDADNKVIDDETAKKFAEENNMKYLSVSAKDGVNIITMFEMMGDACVKAIQKNEKDDIEENNDKKDNNKKNNDNKSGIQKSELSSDNKSVKIRRNVSVKKNRRCC